MAATAAMAPWMAATPPPASCSDRLKELGVGWAVSFARWA